MNFWARDAWEGANQELLAKHQISFRGELAKGAIPSRTPSEEIHVSAGRDAIGSVRFQRVDEQGDHYRVLLTYPNKRSEEITYESVIGADVTAGKAWDYIGGITKRLDAGELTEAEATLHVLALYALEDHLKHNTEQYWAHSSHSDHAHQFAEAASRYIDQTYRQKSGFENSSLTVALRQHMKEQILTQLESNSSPFEHSSAGIRVLGSSVLSLLEREGHTFKLPLFKSPDLAVSPYNEGVVSEEDAHSQDAALYKSIKKASRQAGYGFRSDGNGGIECLQVFTKDQVKDALGESFTSKYNEAEYPVTIKLDVRTIPAHALPSTNNLDPIKPFTPAPQTKLLRSNTNEYFANLLARAMCKNDDFKFENGTFNPSYLVHLYQMMADFKMYRFHPDGKVPDDVKANIRMQTVLAIADMGLKPDDLTVKHIKDGVHDKERHRQLRKALTEYSSYPLAIEDFDMNGIFLQTENAINDLFPRRGSLLENRMHGDEIPYGPLWLRPQEVEFIEKANGFKLLPNGEVQKTGAQPELDVSTLKEIYPDQFSTIPKLAHRIEHVAVSENKENIDMDAPPKSARFLDRDPQFDTHYTLNLVPFSEAIDTLDLKGKTAIEIGVGQGAITRLLLGRAEKDGGPHKVIGYEINESVNPGIDDDRLDLRYENFMEADVSDIEKNIGWENCVVVCNPPYNIIPEIADWIEKKGIPHAVMLSSERRALEGCDGYDVFAYQGGEDFLPVARGHHYIVTKGLTKTKDEGGLKYRDAVLPPSNIVPANSRVEGSSLPKPEKSRAS